MTERPLLTIAISSFNRAANAGKDASMRVISNPALDCVYHLSSWLPRSGCVYYKDTPEVYLRLKEAGYNRRVMNGLILRRLSFKLITAKALTKFLLKFPLDFTRAIPHYVNALRDND